LGLNYSKEKEKCNEAGKRWARRGESLKVKKRKRERKGGGSGGGVKAVMKRKRD